MTNCYKCNSKFISLISRKHHCRICGNIFCKSCLETVCEITIYGGEKKIKVCSYCQQKKIELNNILKNNLVEYTNDKGNLIFETNTSDYIKNKKKNNIEQFCGFTEKMPQSMKDFHNNLNKKYEILLEKMVNQILTEGMDKTKFPNLKEEWGQIIFTSAKAVINNICPSYQDLNDSLNINDLVKIKLISYHDHSNKKSNL